MRLNGFFSLVKPRWRPGGAQMSLFSRFWYHFCIFSWFLYLFFASLFWFLWPATSSQKRAREVLPAFFRLAFLTLLTQMNEQTAVSVTQLQKCGQKRGSHLLLRLPAQGAKKHWFLWPATSSQKRAREVLLAFFRLAFLTLLTQMNEQTAVSATQLQVLAKNVADISYCSFLRRVLKHGAAVYRRRRFQYEYYILY